jgi:hypothetical protein
MANFDKPLFVPTLSVCLQLLGRFARFLLVEGDDGDLPKSSASHEPGFARITSRKSATNSSAHAQYSALRSAVNGQSGDKWRHPRDGHAYS